MFEILDQKWNYFEWQWLWNTTLSHDSDKFDWNSPGLRFKNDFHEIWRIFLHRGIKGNFHKTSLNQKKSLLFIIFIQKLHEYNTLKILLADISKLITRNCNISRPPLKNIMFNRLVSHCYWWHDANFRKNILYTRVFGDLCLWDIQLWFNLF